MYGRFACGTQAGAAAWGSTNDEVPVQPQGNTDGQQPPVPVPVPVPQPNEEMQHGQDQYQHQHQHPDRRRDASQTPQPSLSSADAPSPDTVGKSSPTRTVERLARKLSKQNLQLSHQKHGQLQTQPQPLSLPSPAVLPNAPEPPSFREWAELEADGQPQQHFAPPHSAGHITPWLLSVPEPSEPIEVDESYLKKPDEGRLDVKQPRRRPSGYLRGGHVSKRPVDPRLEGMIANEMQCSVRAEPPAMPATSTPSSPSTSTAGQTRIIQAPFIEPDPDYVVPNNALEPDDDEDEGMVDILREDLGLAEGGIPLRAAIGPGGIRKHTVGGISLRYRLSVDAALRCANVVRSRPRMRKRAKNRHGSTTSSAATSVAPSPVIPPSVPSGSQLGPTPPS
ncbi:hypothetical protein MMYC01_202988 [Madurella mycetomatis]|uniref:Uncharacterized protein n=1 Tax=Madurella mycetomatis TaxID=100816 RepID=A0A175WFF4_9PEZI|nr:hypothetical protein MMYC01_202988 [Madurella mycetomatis]